MNPRRLIFVIMLITTCAIWIYDVTLVFRGVSIDVTTSEHVIGKKLLEKYDYKTDFPDPFFCSLFMTKKKEIFVKSEAPSASRNASTVLLPICRIGGIVYTPGNPMAIFISGEKSQLVKQGDIIDSIMIISIKPQVVEVSYRKKKFNLTQ